MKKILSFVIALVAMFSCLACGNKLVINESDTYIVINAEKVDSSTALVDYMSQLQEKNLLEFTVSNGMVTSINGLYNASDYSSCWMLYTSDTENSSTAGDTVEYKGKTYGMAMSGVETLTVKSGEVYIWIYQTF